MKNIADIITQISETIYPNEYEQIDAQKHQDLLKEIANSFVNKLNVIRSANDVAVTSGEHTITFSSPLPTSDYSLNIIDKNGIGISYVSQDENGFTYDSLGNGVINYIAIVNI